MLDRLPSSARLWVAGALAVVGIAVLVIVIMRSTRPEDDSSPALNSAAILQNNLKSVQNNPNIPPEAKERAIAAIQAQINAAAARQPAIQAQAKAMESQAKAAADAPVKK